MTLPTDPSRAAGRVLLETVVQTDHGQFDLIWRDGYVGFGGDWGEAFAGQTNGLVGAASGDGLYVNLAHQYGGSAMRIVVLDDEPPVDGDAWEDIVEVSIVEPDGAQPRWSTFLGMQAGVLDLAAGSYRVRANERGRDRAHA